MECSLVDRYQPDDLGTVAAVLTGALTATQPATVRAEDGAHLVDDLQAAFGRNSPDTPSGMKSDVIKPRIWSLT
jgi:hypothetical protein